jgi:hypothetical protein
MSKKLNDIWEREIKSAAFTTRDRCKENLFFWNLDTIKKFIALDGKRYLGAKLNWKY